ncbi:LysR substrate-binding domain-containing protein [Stenotrophomonas sp. GZD-301]|uniref:LysR substrate-binding domain-containing protein n=1 Tax=Stenotrophomonas sp. GZD-301 TaxID=3404814 RepID=UPI003BB69A9B
MGKGLDIDVLRTFQAVTRFGRFKDAAAYVHRSPSAVTAQIQKLEATLGQQLLVRSNHAVELTLAGQQLLTETTRFLMAHDRLLAKLTPQRITGRVRLGVPDGYAESFMSEFLPAVAADNPALELDVVVRSSTELLALFARQQLDLAIAVSREHPGPGLRLRSTLPCWAAAPGFRHDPELPVNVALQLSGCPYREAGVAALKEHGIRYRILLESANAHAVLACVRSGVAVGIVDALDVARDGSLICPAGLERVTLPAHHVYVLTDTSHHAAQHLRGMVTSTFL